MINNELECARVHKNRWKTGNYKGRGTTGVV